MIYVLKWSVTNVTFPSLTLDVSLTYEVPSLESLYTAIKSLLKLLGTSTVNSILPLAGF